MRRAVEAPFQLLVSVFTMVMVVSIAFYVLKMVGSENCAKRWTQSTEDLASAIVRVGMSEPPTTSSARLVIHCGNSGKHEYQFVQLSGGDCTRVCGEVSDTCYGIQHQIYDVRGELLRTDRICLRGMSPYMYFLLQSGHSDCPAGYDPFITDTVNMVAGVEGGTVLPVFVFRTSNGIALCVKRS